MLRGTSFIVYSMAKGISHHVLPCNRIGEFLAESGSSLPFFTFNGIDPYSLRVLSAFLHMKGFNVFTDKWKNYNEEDPLNVIAIPPSVRPIDANANKGYIHLGIRIGEYTNIAISCASCDIEKIEAFPALPIVPDASLLVGTNVTGAGLSHIGTLSREENSLSIFSSEYVSASMKVIQDSGPFTVISHIEY